MVSAADIVREQEEGLALLFQRGLELALQVQADAMAADSAEARAKLAQAFHRISRGVRQTAALRTRLAREASLASREAAAEVTARDQARVRRRQDQLRAEVQRLIWREAEDADARFDLDSELDDLLDVEARDAGFTAEALAPQIARICEALGLPQPDPPPLGEGDREAVEGAEAHGQRPALQPPQSRRDSSPSGGASPEPDDYWRSSA